MKFVLDKRTGQFVPDTWLDRVSEPEVKQAVYSWLDLHPYVPKELSFSTRSIGYRFLQENKQYSSNELELIRDAVAVWYNKNRKLADSAVRPVTEDIDDEDDDEGYIEEYKGYEIIDVRGGFAPFIARSQEGPDFNSVDEVRAWIDTQVAKKVQKDDLKTRIKKSKWSKKAAENLLLSRGWVMNTYRTHKDSNEKPTYLMLKQFSRNSFNLEHYAFKDDDQKIAAMEGKWFLFWADTIKEPYTPIAFDMSAQSKAQLFIEWLPIIWRNSGLAESYENMYANDDGSYSATEDAGACAAGVGCDGGVGIGPQTAGVPQSGTIASVSCPELHKKKKKTAKEADSPEEILARVPKKNKNGNCYQTAWHTFYANLDKKPLLCHGIVIGRGPIEGIEYNHAWVELPDGTVIDNTMPIFADGVPKEVYYALGGVREDKVFRYNSEEIAKKVVEQGTYGPWETILWQYP